MILHTTEVVPLPDYRLRVRFSNGEAGVVDLTGELTGEMFEGLRNPAVFASACQHPVMKTVVWDNRADLAPEFLIELLHRQQQIAA